MLNSSQGDLGYRRWQRSWCRWQMKLRWRRNWRKSSVVCSPSIRHVWRIIYDRWFCASFWVQHINICDGRDFKHVLLNRLYLSLASEEDFSSFQTDWRNLTGSLKIKDSSETMDSVNEEDPAEGAYGAIYSSQVDGYWCSASYEVFKEFRTYYELYYLQHKIYD